MNILITGASRGIGRDLAIHLAQQPANQILVLSRNEARLKELSDQYRNIRHLKYDLGRPDPEALKDQLDGWEKLDILVNNAGLLVKKPFEQLSASDWQRSFNVNFFGPVELTQLCLPLLKNSKQGHIINITSMGGFQGSSKFPGLSAYSASKAALGNLTECLAEELKEENVAVNALALGAVQTEMLAEAFPGFEPPMHSEQMARFIADFAVNGRQFFNGKVLPVSTSTP
jgi:3-oxoacyl-[acyl-carrier protein] reductase